MMRYADPQQITCAQCGTASDQAVETLLLLSASCPKCGHSFATVGEEMRGFELAVAECAAALEIVTEIELIDPRLSFRDGDFWNVVGGEPLPPRKYLRDVLEMVNAAVARLPADGNPRPNAWTLQTDCADNR